MEKGSCDQHVSHRFALDWLFDRINLDKAIQFTYVSTAQQIAGVLTRRFIKHTHVALCGGRILSQEKQVEANRRDAQWASLGKMKATPWTLSTEKKMDQEAMTEAGHNDENPSNTSWGNLVRPYSSPKTLQHSAWVKKVKQSIEFWWIIKFTKHIRFFESVQARLQDLTHVAAEVFGISLWKKWQTESWNNFVCVGVTKIGRLLRFLRLCVSTDPERNGKRYLARWKTWRDWQGKERYLGQ